MNEYILITDSCCDLPFSVAEDMKLISIPLGVTVDDESFEANLDEKAITFNHFYDLLAGSKSASTFAINTAKFMETLPRKLATHQDEIPKDPF